MEINVPKEGIIGLIDKLCEKIFKEDDASSQRQRDLFKVRFNKRISSHLRNIVYTGLLSREKDKLQKLLAEESTDLNVKERLSIVGYNLKTTGLINKANKLEKMVSSIDFTSSERSAFTGQLDVLCEVHSVLKVLLALSQNPKLMTQDPCEVWRKEDTSTQFLRPVQSEPPPFHYNNPRVDCTKQFNLDYQYYPSEVFEAVSSFGVPKNGFDKEDLSLCVNMLNQEPGSCGLIRWFGVKKCRDSFGKRTRTTLYNALIHSHTSDIDVKLSLPDLPLHPEQRFSAKLSNTTMISEDEGFAEVSDEQDPSVMPTFSDDSGVHSLKFWDKALKQELSQFHTWERRKKIISKNCKPFITEAGPEVVDCLYDMKIKEASYFISYQSPSFKYLRMIELIRDGLNVLIGVPSKTFRIEKSTSSFLVSPTVRLSGCSPDSLVLILNGLADIGTNYLRLNKFTTHQKHSILVQSSVLRAFITGLRKYLQKYRQTVITLEACHVRSVLDLSTKLRKQAHELKFLADICMCSQGFVGEFGKPKPKFPMGVKLLSYLYQLCLINSSSPVANLLLFLLKVSCTPYLRFLQHWVFKGRCTDVYKEFMIHENDVYLAYRDKRYWTQGYAMSSTTKMEGVPVFLKNLANDMFTCGKSINLLKLCFPGHYICNHQIDVPVMNVVYSLNSLKVISDSSGRYCDEMKKLQQEKKLDLERKKNEEKSRMEFVLIDERQKANRALAEVQELLKKARESLAEKKKEELDFLKQQMEDALNKKVIDAKKAEEEDARFAKNSLFYEATTANVEEQLKEKAREELIRHYDMLTREAERREMRTMWLARRQALKKERETFLEDETNRLERMRTEMNDKLEKEERLTAVRDDEHKSISFTKRKQWVMNDEASNPIIKGENGVGQLTAHPSHSTVQNLIYYEDVRNSQTGIPDKTLVESRQSLEREVKTPARHPAESTVQNLIYPSTTENIVSQTTTEHPTSDVERSRGTKENGYLSLSKSSDVTIKSAVGRAKGSTIEHLLYPADEKSSVTVISTVDTEPPSPNEGLFYRDTISKDFRVRSTRGSAPPSTIETLLYPDNANEDFRVKSTRGREPPSTIQKLLYPSVSDIPEPEKKKREPLTHEDVWLASQFESLPDNFDVMDEPPFGDIFVRVIQGREGLRDAFYGAEMDENLESENDACKVLCLPVILEGCVMEPLITQIDLVNAATINYFMDDLKLMEHFETLKKFLLMEDGEFSLSLTQQLFEKVSSGVTPRQLCCISTLNSIMAHAIQSSVYASHSENTRSLSFVLKSVPDVFKRNDVQVFDFIELRYKIQWPVNIVITENCISKYNRIFAFMLRLKRTAWILQEIRYYLKRVDRSANNSPQLRKVHLFRHEMNRFVNDVQGYISNQILHVTWEEFLRSLAQNVRNLNDIHDCHADYLNKALFRALLNKKAAPVLKIISDLLTMVLKFHTQLTSASWHTDPLSGHLVHPAFPLLCSTHESFKESTCFLFTVITKLVTRGYQPHLEELLLRLDFNSFYGEI